MFLYNKISCKQLSKRNFLNKKGAGDAFVGSFAHYLNSYGKDSIEKTIDLANDYATLSVRSHGTQTSYPYLNQLEDKFKV